MSSERPRLRPVVGIMGSGTEPWREFAAPLAAWIARQGYHLLTGGGGGVMAAAAEAFQAVQPRLGLCIGILPTAPDPDAGYAPLAGYPNPWVDLAIISPLSRFNPDRPDQPSRNQINILTSHVVVALPGSVGTRNEVDLAMKFGRPLLLFGPSASFNTWPVSLPRAQALSEAQQFIVRNLAEDPEPA